MPFIKNTGIGLWLVFDSHFHNITFWAFALETWFICFRFRSGKYGPDRLEYLARKSFQPDRWERYRFTVFYSRRSDSDSSGTLYLIWNNVRTLMISDALFIYDFHPVALSIPYLITAFYAYTKKWRLYWLFAFLALMTKEEVSLQVTMLGVYIFFFH